MPTAKLWLGHAADARTTSGFQRRMERLELEQVQCDALAFVLEYVLPRRNDKLFTYLMLPGDHDEHSTEAKDILFGQVLTDLWWLDDRVREELMGQENDPDAAWALSVLDEMDADGD